MKIILIGNYKPDAQESMLRFAQMLLQGFAKAGIAAQCWYPPVILGRFFPSTNSGIGKWMGYVDKWIFFPILLLLRRLSLRGSAVRFHICDHSNAPYLRYLPGKSTVITCHDVIAIRAGLGYEDTHVFPSRMGRLLQKRILHSLSKAERIAVVSNLTLNQLQEIAEETSADRKTWRVVHNSYNATFFPLSEAECQQALEDIGLAGAEPFILHVGHDHPRKNRKLLLEMAGILGKEWKGKICFTGKPVSPAMRQMAEELGLQDRIVSVVKADHKTLQALYSRCYAFIFPSFSEGFGWPIIEAQACGAPVITSAIEPMPEVGGKGALYADPNRPETFAQAFLQLKDKAFRAELVQNGYQNTQRFQPDVMIQEYLKIHGIAANVSQTN